MVRDFSAVVWILIPVSSSEHRGVPDTNPPDAVFVFPGNEGEFRIQNEEFRIQNSE